MEWIAKTDTLIKTYHWIIRNDSTIKNDRDSLFSKRIHAPNIEKLGFKLDENGRLVLDSLVREQFKIEKHYFKTKDLK